jgi:hypothetical protein
LRHAERWLRTWFQTRFLKKKMRLGEQHDGHFLPEANFQQ